MKIAIVYDNIASKPGLITDRGFSCFIDCKTKKMFEF